MATASEGREDRFGSNLAVISALASGLLYPGHPTLVMCVGTSRSCQERMMHRKIRRGGFRSSITSSAVASSAVGLQGERPSQAFMLIANLNSAARMAGSQAAHP